MVIDTACHTLYPGSAHVFDQHTFQPKPGQHGFTLLNELYQCKIIGDVTVTFSKVGPTAQRGLPRLELILRTGIGKGDGRHYEKE